MMIPLVPPETPRVAAVPVGNVPPRVVGTLKDITQPAPTGHATAPVAPFDWTLRKIRSVLPVSLSVTGEQVVSALETASTGVPVVASESLVILSWYSVAFPDVLPQTYRLPLGLAPDADV